MSNRLTKHKNLYDKLMLNDNVIPETREEAFDLALILTLRGESYTGMVSDSKWNSSKHTQLLAQIMDGENVVPETRDEAVKLAIVRNHHNNGGSGGTGNTVNLSNYYKKSQVDELLAGKADSTDLADYYLKTQTYSQSEVDTALADKVDSTELANYYKKTETYSQSEVDNKVADYTKTVDLADIATSGSYNDLADKPTIPSKVSELENDSKYQTESDVTTTLTGYATKTYVEEQIANAEHLKREIVTVLPSDAEASDNIIYMLKVESTTGNDKYQEYMKIDGTVQMVGDTSVDLTDYAKTVDIPTTVAELADSAGYAKTTDIPTALPANGGNADTVNNHTVKSDVPENAVFTDTVLEINDADVSKTTVWSSDKTASEIASAITGGEVDLSAYQKKNDAGLCTMAQDVVGAINEVKEAVDGKINYDDTEVKADIAELQTKAHTHANAEVLDGITSESIQSWNNKSEFDGNYNSLSNKPLIPENISDLTNDYGYITNSVVNLINYYNKSDTYSKTEVTELLSNINHLTSEIVSSLPIENIKTTTIYLIKEADNNTYKQYMYISNNWAELGSTDINLMNYATKTDLDNKVDKIDGKGLSTNDFTNVYLSKLEGVESGANKTIVDTSLSTTSTNPIQNSVTTSALNSKANKDGSNATGTWEIDISGVAAKATADKNGNDITTTYAKQADFEKIVGNVDIIDYTSQITNTGFVASMWTTNIRKFGHVVTFVINITLKAVSSGAILLGTIPEGVRPPVDISYNILTNNGDACYVFIDRNGQFGIRKINSAEFKANDGIRFCANYITEE